MSNQRSSVGCDIRISSRDSIDSAKTPQTTLSATSPRERLRTKTVMFAMPNLRAHWTAKPSASVMGWTPPFVCRARSRRWFPWAWGSVSQTRGVRHACYDRGRHLSRAHVACCLLTGATLACMARQRIGLLGQLLLDRPNRRRWRGATRASAIEEVQSETRLVWQGSSPPNLRHTERESP